jgi:hypothetical protein
MNKVKIVQTTFNRHASITQLIMSTLILKTRNLSLIQALKQWIDRLEINEEQSARRIIKLIPAQCPFAREVRIFGQTIFRIPPLCKLNPLYEQLIALRFRALCFLVEQCGEDITEQNTEARKLPCFKWERKRDTADLSTVSFSFGQSLDIVS